MILDTCVETTEYADCTGWKWYVSLSGASVPNLFVSLGDLEGPVVTVDNLL